MPKGIEIFCLKKGLSPNVKFGYIFQISVNFEKYIIEAH